MKTWIVYSLDEETIQGEETNQGRKLYEEIRYIFSFSTSFDYVREFLTILFKQIIFFDSAGKGNTFIFKLYGIQTVFSSIVGLFIQPVLQRENWNLKTD